MKILALRILCGVLIAVISALWLVPYFFMSGVIGVQKEAAYLYGKWRDQDRRFRRRARSTFV